MQPSAGQDAESTFRSWVREHTGLIYRVACGFAVSREDREDLTQEILLQMWRSLPRYRAEAKVSTWIYRVALNTALAWRRKETKHTQRRAALPSEDLPGETQDGSVAKDRELLEGLYVAIAALPKVDAALVMMYLEDLSGNEMAAILGISEENVRARLSRAKKSLSQAMKEVVHEP